MKKIILFAVFLMGLAITALTFSQYPSQEGGSNLHIISWVSKNSTDSVTIQNGTGIRIMVEITVKGGDKNQFAGLNIKNCGITTHVDPGSSAICYSNDPNRPISFSSDNGTVPASGSYYIRELI